MPWWGWIVVAAVLLGAEMFVPTDFFLVFLGASALIVGLFGLVGVEAPVWAQWLAFAVLAVGSLVFFRGWLRAHIRPVSRIDDALVGETAIAQEPIAPGGMGRVELRGATWSARNAGSTSIATGDRVPVVSVDRLTLHVRHEA
jgi:membrane protein implicated in regulation of membrane protease activity